jgi:hypothetical protein
VAALLDKLETSACFRRERDNRRRAGWNKGGKVRSRNKSKRIQRRRLIFVPAFYFPFARLVHMGMVRMVVVMRVQMRVDQRRMIVRIAVTMDVLKRRQDKGGDKSQTAGECENLPHQKQPTSARDSSLSIKEHTVTRNCAGRAHGATESA